MVVLPVSWHLFITGWHDIIEIMLCISACYYITAWLNKDKQSRLLATAYGYCATLFISYLLPLPTIYIALLTFAPLVVATLLMIHKESLQKSFVALHRITPAVKQQHYWVQDCIQIALISMNHHTPLAFVIEKHQALDAFVKTEHPLHTTFCTNIGTLLIEHKQAPESFLWLSNDGTLCGYDCTFLLTSIDAWFAQETQHQDVWIQQALVFSSKTDALFIRTDPVSRTFTIITQGTKTDYVSAGKTIEQITAHTGTPFPTDQGESHEHVGSKKITVQKLQP
jgi:hypothetical protein